MATGLIGDVSVSASSQAAGQQSLGNVTFNNNAGGGTAITGTVPPETASTTLKTAMWQNVVKWTLIAACPVAVFVVWWFFLRKKKAR